MSNSYEKDKVRKILNGTDKKKINYILLPLIFILAVIPLIVRVKFFDTNLSQFTWFQTSGKSSDFFAYYKSLFFVMINIIMALIMAYKIYIKRKAIKFSKLFIPLGGYAIMAIISSVLSKYTYFSTHGMIEQFETIFVLMGYCLTAYYAFVVVNSEEDINYLVKWWTVGIIVACVIGLSQFFGMDFYMTEIGKSLIAPGVGGLNFVAGVNRVYLSLLNANYVGVYVTLVIPILFVLILSNHDAKKQIGYGVILMGVMLCFFGSRSKSALIALNIIAFCAIIMLRKVLRQKWKVLFSILGILILVLVITSNRNDVSFISRVRGMFNQEKVVYNLTDIRTNQDDVEIDYKGNTLAISLEVETESGGQLRFVDQVGKVLVSYTATDESDGKIYTFIDDERFVDVKVEIVSFQEGIGFDVYIDNNEWAFSNQTGKEGYYYFNRVGRWDKIEKSDSAIFTDIPMFASGRGYLWAKTIPLMKDHILIGSGPDTYAVEFPQRDYVDNYNAGYGDTLITKPHNMYMQMAVQTGGISLVLFLIFCLWYIASSVKIYFNCNYERSLEFLGLGILLSITGYLITGLSNDSTITCSGIFWALIGIGIAVNQIMKASIKQQGAKD